MKKLLLLSVFLTVFFFPGCNKSDDNFNYCEGCFLSSWEGYYAGTGNYYVFNTGSGEAFNDIQVQINIDNTYDSTLAIDIEAVGYISERFQTSKRNQTYYMNIGAGARTLDLGLKKRGNEFKIDGALKLNSWNKVDSTWTVYKSLTFEAHKK